MGAGSDRLLAALQVSAADRRRWKRQGGGGPGPRRTPRRELLQALRRDVAEHIECACSGVMACSTCHVVVDPIWYEAVGAADEDEEDMLDLAHDPRRTSRLGCQVKLTPALDGMVVWVPHGANNMMDDIPEWSTDR